MVFSCTRKIIGKLKKYRSIDEAKEDIHLYNWYVDLITIERKKYFLFTNSESLFSFFIYSGTKKELQNIEFLFEEKLKKEIIRQIGSSLQYTENAFPDENTYKFTKTNSRSILGSMNDFKNLIKGYMETNQGLFDNEVKLIDWLNEIPMGGIDYKSPKRKMKSIIESKF